MMIDSDGPARRKLLTYSGSVTAGGLLAGCTGSFESDATATDAAATDTTATIDATATSESTAESAADGSSHTVSMTLIGDVTFEGVPGSILTWLTHHAGMAFALGHGDTVNVMHVLDYYDTLWNQFTPRLPGVELDWTGLYSLWEPSKERLYELDDDVHLADPASVSALGSRSQTDLDEIKESISPWFGNSFSARHQASPTEWINAHEYYSPWEIFAKVARAFQAEAKYRALTAAHEELLVTIVTDLPTEEDQPAAMLLGPSDLESIYAYNLSTPEFLTAHTRPLKPVSTFGNDVKFGLAVGSEMLPGADPDVIFTLGGMHPNTSMPDIRTGFQDDPVRAEISAVRNNRIYMRDGRCQGPILNLFQLKMTVKQLFPDRLGAWPQYSEGPYPRIPEEEQLFDRQHVADIISENL